MIQFKIWKQYTHVVNDGVRFPQNNKKPFALIYFSENSNFINDYPKLNLKRIDARIVTVPTTKIPKTILTSELRQYYKKLGLIPYSMNQKIPQGQNVIVDLSQYFYAIDQVYHPTTYRQRPGMLIENILKRLENYFPENYQTILFYSVDLTKDINAFINKKVFPIIKSMKKEDFLFDHMLINYIDFESSKHRLLVRDGEYNFQRIVHYMKTIKGLKPGVDIQTSSEKASNIIAKIIDKEIDSKNKTKINSSIKDYLKSNPEIRNKVLSGELTADDIRDITTTSILYGVSGDLKHAINISNNIPKARKKLALKVIDKNFSGDLLQPEKTINLSTDLSLQAYQPEHMIENKSPEHIYQKRQIDFKTILKNDLTNSFKVLETKDVPLKFENIKIVDKPQKAGEIEKTDLSIVEIQLSDDFGNKHNLQIEIPKIDPNTGIFRINGQQKALINQIVQNPITFPKPGESRFESSYSVFRIYVKKLRHVTYLESFMTYKIPFIYLLSYSFGFEETLKLYKIKYEIVDKKIPGEKFICKLQNGRYIIFKNVNSPLQQCLCQSFLQGNPDKYKIKAEFGTKEYFEQYIIKISGRINSPYLITSNLQNIVDPVAKQVLRNKQLPTDLKMIMKYMAENVVKEKVIARNDISNQRIRNSEVLVHLAQKQILAAYTVYKEQVLSGNTEAQFTIVPTKVLSDFMLTELVTNMEYANPLEEMSTLTRVSPAGKKVGGIPDKQAIQVGARNVHDSYFGNIDPLDTSESDNIGVVQQLTIDALISSSRGMFAIKDINNQEKSGMLSTSTCMIPFLENTDGARVIMLSNQSKQMIPLKDPQPPIVQSGYESVLTNILSNNFIKKSPCDGKVSSITKEYITVECGQAKTKKKIDLSAKHLKSGSGKDTLSVFKPIVKSGEKVKKNQLLAEGACMSDGAIAMGRPLLTALMPYDGYNFEDGIVINENIITQGKMTSLHGVVEEVLVAEDDRILFIAEEGQTLEKGSPLLRKTIGEIEQLIGFEDDVTTDVLAGQYIKKSPGGKIVDIEIYSNVEHGKMPLIDKLVDKTKKKYKTKTNEKFRIKGQIIKGVVIRFRIEQELKTGLGDKLCNRYGNKGIISLVEDDNLMPRLPNGDRVDIILNPIGLIARMNMGQLFEMYCGLISRELGRRIPSLNKVKTIALISQVFKHLDTSKNKSSTRRLMRNIANLSNIKYKQFVEQIKKTGFYPIIIPPFQAPKEPEIRKALKVLGLKTGYHLKLPKYNGVKTAKAVPVGYMYISKLEHLGDEKLHARSTGPMVSKTLQPTGGKAKNGGNRLGELDSYTFFTYNCPNVLAEFMGPLSDDLVTKEEMLSEIIQNGNTEYKHAKFSPAKELLNSYFISLMLSR